jgi:hypothetical protein
MEITTQMPIDGHYWMYKRTWPWYNTSSELDCSITGFSCCLLSFQHVQIETRKHTPWQSNMRVTLYCLIVQGEHSCQNSQSFKASVQLQLGLTPVGDFFGCLILSSSTVTRWSELYVSPHAHAYYIYYIIYMIYNILYIYIIIYIFENPRLLGERYKATEPINWGSTFRGVGIVDSSACGCMVSSIESAPAQGQQPTPPERHRVALSFATCKRSFTTNDKSLFITICICNYTHIYIYIPL